MKISSLFSVLAVLAATSSTVLAMPTNVPYVAHETRSVEPSGWVKRAKLAPAQRLPMRIGLKQSNIDRLEDLLMEVADPDSDKYGQHYTAGEIVDIFAPTSETVEAVREWLHDAGIAPERIHLSRNKGWLEFEATVAEAEDLLKTKYHFFEHEPTLTGHIASDTYHVPAAVAHHIDLITPTLHFDAKLRDRDVDLKKREKDFGKRTIGTDGATINHILNSGNNPGRPVVGENLGMKIFKELTECDKTITPICLQALYHFDPNLQVNYAAKKNSIGIVEYSPVYVLFSDLTLFEGNYTAHAQGYKPNVALINGATEQQLYGISQPFNTYGEGNLDVQYGVALTYPVPMTILQVGPDDGSGSFNTLLDAIDGSYCSFEGGDNYQQGDPHTTSCGTVSPPNVISTSYGYNEQDLSPAYEARQCQEYAKLGMMGVSMVFSSGDYGVAGNGGQCINPGFTSYNNGGSGIFNPAFPSTCPYITSVGATQINPGSSVFDAESACEQVIYSGGGFSNNFALPSYQAQAVGNYFKNHNPPYGADRYNNSQKTRGFPDVSANGANYAVAIEGEYYLVYGTSASSPVFASVITNLNTARLAIGKGPLGFLNPWMYKNPWMFNDITSGGNQGCGTAGFTAVDGWDPVTGLGTPSLDRMLPAALLK